MAERSTTYRQGTGEVTSQYIGADLSAEDLAKRKDAAKFGSTAGTGLGAKGKASGIPKQEAGESISSYSKRMREYREMQSTPAEEGQRKALKGMAK